MTTLRPPVSDDCDAASCRRISLQFRPPARPVLMSRNPPVRTITNGGGSISFHFPSSVLCRPPCFPPPSDPYLGHFKTSQTPPRRAKNIFWPFRHPYQVGLPPLCLWDAWDGLGRLVGRVQCSKSPVFTESGTVGRVLDSTRPPLRPLSSAFFGFFAVNSITPNHTA
jgi:hypothetical protein